jgi:TRAP-type C4-dicarboxylate transport system substrate-binding protein
MALLAWLAAFLPLNAGAEPAALKLSFFASETEVNYARAIKPWIDAVNADPSGAVKIEAYPNGALGKALPAQPQLLLDGVADIAFVNPSLGPGRFPDDQVFELPGLLQNLKEGVKLYEELLKANLLRGYSDYYVVGAFMNPQYMVFARRPIKSLADLKGMKVRINGAVIGQTVKELGMVPILMPPNEVVEAMGRGTIDATTTVPAAIVDFGIDRVTSHDYLLPFGAGPLAVLMNRKKFDSLPKPAGRDREILDPLDRRHLPRPRAIQRRADSEVQGRSQAHRDASIASGHREPAAGLSEGHRRMDRQEPGKCRAVEQGARTVGRDQGQVA